MGGGARRGCGLFLLLVVIVGAIVAGLFFTTLALGRSDMPYNEEGRYFDPESELVFLKQAMEVYWLLAGVSWLTAVACVALYLRQRAR